MNKEISRIIKVDNWLFEVKAIRALKVKQYGEPYQAIANINLSGDNAYIDGLMSKGTNGISEQDFQHLKEVCKEFGIEEVEFASYANENKYLKHVKGFA